MITFTHMIDNLPLSPPMHSYTIQGEYLEFDDTIIYVAEYSTNLVLIMQALEFYIKASPGVVIKYNTIKR